jgi:hypothetical protein
MIKLLEMIDVIAIESVVKKYTSFIRINDNESEYAVQLGNVNDANNFQMELMMDHAIYGSIEVDEDDSNPYSKGANTYFVVIQKEEV